MFSKNCRLQRVALVSFTGRWEELGQWTNSNFYPRGMNCFLSDFFKGKDGLMENIQMFRKLIGKWMEVMDNEI
ncbi:MAG: hypothetical protein K6U80_00035 [Firmicutes bacterium]|nr:hypothetical protein [Bacillota bacterium]